MLRLGFNQEEQKPFFSTNKGGIDMSYADDFEDVGGYLAELDYMASVCEEQDGACSDCPEKDNCNYYEEKARWSYDKRRN